MAIHYRAAKNSLRGTGWLRVYHGQGRLLSKLSKAQSNGKFRERHSAHVVTTDA
jgi:hypothetical protein